MFWIRKINNIQKWPIGKITENWTRFQSTCSAKLYEEVRIPVPWGHIAGKWWGPHNIRPILTFHGWQDNCGTFDRLIPLLPDHLSYLALDLPGHGLSSRLPAGVFYHNFNGIIDIRRLQTYFKWEKVSLMGHSLGSIVSFTYAGFYPASVDLLICLEGLSPLISPKKLDRVTESIDNFLKYDQHASNSREPPSHTKEEMIQMVHQGSRKSIELENCMYILERNIQPSTEHPNKFFFSRDPRVKTGPLLNWPLEDIFDHAKQVQMPIFATFAEQRPVPAVATIYQQVLDILRKNPHFEFHSLKGKHHAHLNNPENYKDLIATFIRKYATEERGISGDVFENISLK